MCVYCNIIIFTCNQEWLVTGALSAFFKRFMLFNRAPSMFGASDAVQAIQSQLFAQLWRLWASMKLGY